MSLLKTISNGLDIKIFQPRLSVFNYQENLVKILVNLKDAVLFFEAIELTILNSSGEHNHLVDHYFTYNDEGYFKKHLLNGFFKTDEIIAAQFDLHSILNPNSNEEIEVDYLKEYFPGITDRGTGNFMTVKELTPHYFHFIDSVKQQILTLSDDLVFDDIRCNTLITEYSSINSALEKFAYLGLEQLLKITPTLSFTEATPLLQAGLLEIDEMLKLTPGPPTSAQDLFQSPFYNRDKVMLYKEKLTHLLNQSKKMPLLERLNHCLKDMDTAPNPTSRGNCAATAL